MAAAPRLTEPWLVPIDAFGLAVTRRLLTRGRARRVDHGDLGALLTRSRPTLLVAIGSSWRGELTAIGELAATEGVWWLPVVFREGAIDIGPAIGPGSPACHQCLRAREGPHDADRPTAEAAAPPATERTAFLPAHAWQAAGIITRLTVAKASTRASAATISLGLPDSLGRYDTVPVGARSATGVHGPTGCGTRPCTAPEQEER